MLFCVVIDNKECRVRPRQDMMKSTHYNFTSVTRVQQAGSVHVGACETTTISLAMGMASKGQSNMNALTGPMFNELYGKVAIRVTLIPDVSIMRN